MLYIYIINQHLHKYLWVNLDAKQKSIIINETTNSFKIRIQHIMVYVNTKSDY